MDGKLLTESNLTCADEIYSELIQLHDALDDRASALVNAKLILLLINHIGDENVIREAIRLSRQKKVAAAYPEDTPIH